MNGKPKIAAFDVDGTLTFTDSFLLFLRFTTTRIGFVIRIFSVLPYFAAYILKIIDRDTTKNALLRAFLNKMSLEDYLTKCESFAKTIYPQILHEDALDFIEKEKLACDEVALVSASLNDYLVLFAKSLNIKHTIATNIDKNDNSLTGKMAGLNCRGIEKCNRIYDYFGDCIIEAAYGDSEGDREMLAAANRPNYRKICKKPKNSQQIVRKLYWGF